MISAAGAWSSEMKSAGRVGSTVKVSKPSERATRTWREPMCPTPTITARIQWQSRLTMRR